MRRWTRSCVSLSQLLLTTLLLVVVSVSPCSASTPSTLRPLLGSRVAQFLARRAVTTTAGSTIALTTPAAASIVGRSAAVNSGFRGFSQRATRLQCKLQKNYSLRAIVGDVYTNNGDGEEVILPRRVNVRPLVSSITTVAANAAGEAMEAFVGGYVLGAFTGCSRRLYLGVKHYSLPAAVCPQVLPYPFLTRFSQQSLQFHAHNLAWGTEWAKISAVFATCRSITKIARHNQEDAWNSVVGSAMAGAVLGIQAKGKRNLTVLPKAATRGALLYGGTMLLLHPGLWRQGMEMCSLTNTRGNHGLVLEQQAEPWYNQISWIE